jgi:hypothetical protein
LTGKSVKFDRRSLEGKKIKKKLNWAVPGDILFHRDAECAAATPTLGKEGEEEEEEEETNA